MPEPLTSPPPLNAKAPVSVATSWIIIIASVAFIAWQANHPPGIEKPEATEEVVSSTEEPLVDEEAANELAMLKLQSRYIIGTLEFTSRLQQSVPGGIKAGQEEQVLTQLASLAASPRGKGAVAMVYAFVKRDSGPEAALQFLDKIEEKAVAPWFASLRDGIANGVTDAERSELKKTFGWFSLLLNPASQDDVSYESQIVAECIKTAAIIGGFTMLVIVAFLVGLVLFILFLVGRRTGSVKMKFNPAEAPSKKHLFLEAFAVYIGIFALGHLCTLYIHPASSMVAYPLSFLLALLWPTIRGCPWGQARDLMGWNTGAGFFREIGAGIVGYLGMIVIASVGILMTVFLFYISNRINGTEESATSAGHPIVGMMDNSQSLGAQLMLVFLAAGVAPFLEETMFRGALYRFFRHRWGFFLSALIGGLIFAVIHPQGWFAVPALCAMGVGFSLLREWRDSIVASMTAHAINNGAIVSLLLLAL